MQRRTLLAVGLAALMLVPAAAAYMPTGNSAPAQGELSSEQPTVTATSQTSEQSGENNYTRLYIEEGYHDGEIKPGESTTFNITVGNSEDYAVELNPHLVPPKVEGRPIQSDWVTIEDADTTLEAGEERTFTVTVAVPEDADLGRYRTMIAFTNETVTYDPGRPARPVHATTLNLEVFEEPTVEIVDGRHRPAQIKAGNSYTYEITVRNTGDESVPLNPSLQTEREHRRHRGEANTVQRSWFEIDAPSEVRPGENATVAVTVSPPESASIGRYDTEIDLGLKDPARPDRNDYWQRVDLYFQVWQQPEQPFTSDFQVSDDTEAVELTLSASQHDRMANDAPASFNVTLVAPDGTTVEPQRVSVTDSGRVSLGAEERPGPVQTEGPYASEDSDTKFVYRVENPEAGEWTVRIMPENTMNFRYDIVREES